MAVKIRLSRIGTKNAPVYRIVVIDERKKRDGAFLEDLGTYNPKGGVLVTFKPERVDEWVSKGAIPTDVVKRLYKKHKLATGAATQAAPVAKAPKAKKKEAQV